MPQDHQNIVMNSRAPIGQRHIEGAKQKSRVREKVKFVDSVKLDKHAPKGKHLNCILSVNHIADAIDDAALDINHIISD